MLVVTDLSRLSRNTAESINYVQVLFVALSIRFISTQLPCLDSYLEPDKVYSMEIPMQSMMNENHAAETSFKIRRTFDNARKNGKFIGAFAGYGWKKDPKDKHKLRIDQEAYEVLQMMKKWVIEGDSVSIVRKRLNDMGIPSPMAYKKEKGIKHAMNCTNPTLLWSHEGVKRVLLRPENVGDLVQGRYKKVSYKIHKQITMPKEKWFICKGAIPPIYTHEEQKLIATVLAKPTRISPKRDKNKVYIFSGFLKCADCGKGVSRKKSNEIVYYNCYTYKKYGLKGCSSHSIKHEELENAILTTIQKQIEVAVDLKNVITNVDKAPLTRKSSTSFEQSIKNNEIELAKIVIYKKSLYEDLKNEIISLEEYRSMKIGYVDEERRIQSILANLNKEKQKIEKVKNKNHPFISEFLKYRNMKHLDRNVMVELIDFIELHENKNITIHFKFMDDYKRIIDCLTEGTGSLK